jgi:hypothetical protein
MAIPEIVKFIKDSRDYGQEDNLIKKILKDTGWEDKLIDDAFLEADSLQKNSKPNDPPKEEKRRGLSPNPPTFFRSGNKRYICTDIPRPKMSRVAVILADFLFPPGEPLHDVFLGGPKFRELKELREDSLPKNGKTFKFIAVLVLVLAVVVALVYYFYKSCDVCGGPYDRDTIGHLVAFLFLVLSAVVALVHYFIY